MEDFSIGVSGRDPRRTKIVPDKPKRYKALNDPTVACCGRDVADCDCRVLITRTLTVKQLVPLHAYDPATVQGAREYEIDLPQEEQVELVQQAVGMTEEDGVQLEFTVRVDRADPHFSFGN